MDAKRYLHGWSVFFEQLRTQFNKKHGMGRPPIRQAIFIARCGRWIAAQQHKPRLNPYWQGDEHER